MNSLIEFSFEVVRSRGWPGRKAMLTGWEVELVSTVCMTRRLFRLKILIRPVGDEEARNGCPSVRNERS
jgi:hypothetical protein